MSACLQQSNAGHFCNEATSVNGKVASVNEARKLVLLIASFRVTCRFWPLLSTCADQSPDSVLGQVSQTVSRVNYKIDHSCCFQSYLVGERSGDTTRPSCHRHAVCVSICHRHGVCLNLSPSRCVSICHSHGVCVGAPRLQKDGV